MKRYSLLLSALLLAYVRVAYAAKGWDGIQDVSVAGFQCLKNSGFDFFVARAWEEVCDYDYTGYQNIKNAWAAGFAHVDAYMFPSHSSGCAPPENQMEATLNQLEAHGAKIGTIWLDIERSSWPADKAANQQFIMGLINQAKAMGKPIGVYTNYNNWDAIVGADWSGASDLPLWYAYWDNEESWNGFSPFGGWTKPAMKQYAGNINGPCGVSMDYDWYA